MTSGLQTPVHGKSQSTPLTKYSWRETGPYTIGGAPRSLHHITQLPEAEARIATLANPIGFDIEWRPNFIKGGKENPIALIQLADQQNILLIKLNATQRRQVPTALRGILEDDRTLKLGVGIKEDAAKVRRDLNIDMKGCLELSNLARGVENERWTVPNKVPGQPPISSGLISLKRLTEAYLERELVKSKKTVMANWEGSLTPSMIDYAANDAASALDIYYALQHRAHSFYSINASWKHPSPASYILYAGAKSLKIAAEHFETAIAAQQANGIATTSSSILQTAIPDTPNSRSSAHSTQPSSLSDKHQKLVRSGLSNSGPRTNSNDRRRRAQDPQPTSYTSSSYRDDKRYSPYNQQDVSRSSPRHPKPYESRHDQRDVGSIANDARS